MLLHSSQNGVLIVRHGRLSVMRVAFQDRCVDLLVCLAGAGALVGSAGTGGVVLLFLLQRSGARWWAERARCVESHLEVVVGRTR